MRFLWVVAVLSVGCFSKPDFEGSGPRPDAAPDASIDGSPLPACGWRDIPDLVTYLPLDDQSGATKIVDASMSMNGGTTFGATLGGPGKIGTAANFSEGMDARIQLDSPTAFDDLPALTVCAWVWLDRIPTSSEQSVTIVDKSSNGYDNGWNFYVEAAAGGHVGFLSPYGHYIASQTTVPTNVWVHHCVTWDGSDGPAGIKLYQNGVDDGRSYAETLNHPTRQSDAGQPIALGRGANANDYNLFGKIDELFLFKAVLSREAIQSLYRCAP